MGQKVLNTLNITGFADEASRSEFKVAAAKGQIPFSFERLLPLAEPEKLERESNSLEEFIVGGETGLCYTFESRDEPPFNGIRQLSHKYPQLLFKMYSEDEAPHFGFSLHKNGTRYVTIFERQEFEITRAAEWPLIAALLSDNRRDEALHRFIRAAAGQLRGDEEFEEELETARGDERRRIEERVEFYRDMLRRRRE